MNSFYNGFFVILLFQGFIWLRSGAGKVLGGSFSNSLGTTLEKFASNNPNIWYKNILLAIAIPNARSIATMIVVLEVLTGLLVIISVIFLLIYPKENKISEAVLILGLAIGFFLNLNFWLASGWTSPTSDGLNLLMMVIEVIGIGVILKQKIV